jgi:hypothetical protein
MIRQFARTVTEKKSFLSPLRRCRRKVGRFMPSISYAACRVERMTRIRVSISGGNLLPSSSSKSRRNPLCRKVFIITNHCKMSIYILQTIFLFRGGRFIGGLWENTGMVCREGFQDLDKFSVRAVNSTLCRQAPGIGLGGGPRMARFGCSSCGSRIGPTKKVSLVLHYRVDTIRQHAVPIRRRMPSINSTEEI